MPKNKDNIIEPISGSFDEVAAKMVQQAAPKTKSIKELDVKNLPQKAAHPLCEHCKRLT